LIKSQRQNLEVGEANKEGGPVFVRVTIKLERLGKGPRMGKKRGKRCRRTPGEGRKRNKSF